MSILNPFQTAFGLEVTNFAVRVVEFVQSRDFLGRTRLRLAAFNELALAPGIVTKGEITDRAKLLKALKKLIHTAQGAIITNKYVVSVLPDQKTFIKKIMLPSSAGPKKEDMEDAVRAEVEKHLPFSPDEIVLDWQVVRRGAEHVELLVGACPKDTVLPYLALLEEIGLVPVALEIEALTIARAVLDPALAERVVLIIDLGKSRSSLAAVDAGVVQFSVSLPLAGTTLTQRIMDMTKLPHEKAEQLKLSCGIDPRRCKGEIAKALTPDLELLTRHIKNAILFYRNNFDGGRQISMIILVGSHGALPGIPEFLATKLRIKTVRGDPFVNVMGRYREKEFLRIPPDRLLAYTTVVGLALRGVVADDIFAA